MSGLIMFKHEVCVLCYPGLDLILWIFISYGFEYLYLIGFCTIVRMCYLELKGCSITLTVCLGH